MTAAATRSSTTCSATAAAPLSGATASVPVHVAGVGAGMGVASANTHTIYAELFNSLANQDAPAGNYADTITVEVAY